MPRRVRTRATRLRDPIGPGQIPPWLREWFESGSHPERGTPEGRELGDVIFPRGPAENVLATHARLEALWGTVRDEIVAAFVRDRPGSRPAGWWRYDAPRDQERPPKESDASFLLRHRLLARGEQGRIPAEAFDPVPAFGSPYPRPFRFERPDPRYYLWRMIAKERDSRTAAGWA